MLLFHVIILFISIETHKGHPGGRNAVSYLVNCVVRAQTMSDQMIYKNQWEESHSHHPVRRDCIKRHC